MEESAGPSVESSFTHKSMNNILQALDRNRRVSPGFNNFRPVDETPQGGNPYPDQPLAGKYM